MDVSLLKAMYCFGWSVWLFIASINNITDAGTNRKLLQRMISMKELRDDPNLGVGLLWRSVNSEAACRWLLYMVVCCHLVVASALLYTALLWMTGAPITEAMTAGTLAFTGFCGVWFTFLCGGLWFGYWIKTPQIQQVHLTLLILGALGALLMQS